MENTDIIGLLKVELKNRKNRNPAFSLRAFAKKLEMSPAQLSQLLNGKRNFTPVTIAKVSKFLGLSSKMEHKLFNQATIARYSFAASDIKKRKMEEDEFVLMSEWHYMAILSLAKLKNAKKDPYWISHRIGITVPQARLAIERMERLGVLEVGNRLKQKGEYLHISSPVPSVAIRKYHRQVLDRAIDGLNGDNNKKDYSAVTFLADPLKVPLVRKKIEEFQDELIEFLKADGKGEVYILSNQLFSCEVKS